VAKAGVEEGVDSIGGSCIIAPSGEVVARCLTKGETLGADGMPLSVLPGGEGAIKFVAACAGDYWAGG